MHVISITVLEAVRDIGILSVYDKIVIEKLERRRKDEIKEILA